MSFPKKLSPLAASFRYRATIIPIDPIVIHAISISAPKRQFEYRLDTAVFLAFIFMLILLSW